MNVSEEAKDRFEATEVTNENSNQTLDLFSEQQAYQELKLHQGEWRKNYS